MYGDDEKKKDKEDYAEVEFELGNLEFEAKGQSIVVERMFQLLLEKIEGGGLVATLKLQDYDEYEQDEDESEEEYEEEEDEEDSSDDFEEVDDHEGKREMVNGALEETIREIDDAIPVDHEDEKAARIPSEAYLDPPPAWDTLDEDSPPESTSEQEEFGTD